ncbi:hypothetical protein B0H14DRAFT_3138559 [Mycena olivaceomarginata]|nr:hypothetical protein B0H14DRAFT_3138559 [Mycena olivaceomarginata]
MLTSFLPTPPPPLYRARVSVDATVPALFGPSNREPTLFTSTCRRARLNPAEPRVPQIHLGNTTQRDNKPGLVVAQPPQRLHRAPAPRSSLSPSYIRSKQHSVTVPLKDQHSGFCTFRGQSAAEDAASCTVLTTYRPHNNIKLVVIQDPPVPKREGCMENKFEMSGNHVLHTSQGSTASQVLCTTSGISRSGGAGSLDKVCTSLFSYSFPLHRQRLVSRTESVLPAPAPPCGPEHCRIVRTLRVI